MGENFDVIAPMGEHDTEGAQRAFEGFLNTYQPLLIHVDNYLEKVISELEPTYAVAYRPWQDALRDLVRGVYLMTRKVPVPDSDKFVEALDMFSFKSATDFLQGLCANCGMSLPRDWAERFRAHIRLLLFSLAIINRDQSRAKQLTPVR